MNLAPDRPIFLSAALVVLLAFPSCATPPTPTPVPVSAAFIFNGEPLVFEFTEQDGIKPPLNQYFGLTATSTRITCPDAIITEVDGKNITLDVKGAVLQIVSINDNARVRGPVETITLPGGSLSPLISDVVLESLEGKTVTLWFYLDFLPGRYFIDFLLVK